MKQLLHLLNRPSYNAFSFVKLPSSVSHFSFRSRQAICSERHQVHYTHTRPITLVVLTNSSSISPSPPPRPLFRPWPEFRSDAPSAEAGRKRCLCWPEPVESSRRHESLGGRTQTPITHRSVWSVSRHVTASGSSVCVLRFYWHVIVLSIGQMKCSSCHKSLKSNCCNFGQGRGFFFASWIFCVGDHTEAANETNNHFHEWDPRFENQFI